MANTINRRNAASRRLRWSTLCTVSSPLLITVLIVHKMSHQNRRTGHARPIDICYSITIQIEHAIEHNSLITSWAACCGAATICPRPQQVVTWTATQGSQLRGHRACHDVAHRTPSVYTKLEVRRPSRSKDMADFQSRHLSARWPWPWPFDL